MKKSEADPVLEALREASADEAKAVALFEIMRWPDSKPACPKCGVEGECYQMRDAKTGERERNWRWRCRACGDRFTVRTGSILEESRLPLHVWAHAYWRGCASKKGVSALQISRECRISYKTALFLMHRIRYAMAPEPGTPLTGTVEADEAYIGGKVRHGTNRAKSDASEQRSAGPFTKGHHKTPVLALVQRGGDVRFRVTDRVTAKRVEAFLAENADRSARLNTDDLQVYERLGKRFRGGHAVVSHTRREYARGDDHSNTVESVFSLLKRALYGTWHSVSKHHLHRYLAEVAFRWNARYVSDSERVTRAVRAGLGKRLVYSDSPLGRMGA